MPRRPYRKRHRASQPRLQRAVGARLAFACLAMALAAGFAACASGSRARIGEPPGGRATGGHQWAPGLRQVGLASYYADRFTGRPTASGEPYRPNLLTAAHRVLPLGTRVRVTRVSRRGKRGPSVVVRINDRGPYKDERIVDLSRAAARRLRMMGPGVVRVELEVIEVPPRRHQRRRR